jgi:tetratricopeptide (TPR) repeat protein
MRGGIFWLIGAIILIAVVVFNRPIQEWSTVWQTQNKVHQALRQGAPDAAIEVYKEALAQYPRQHDLLAGLGQLYLDEQAYTQAEVLFRNALEHDPNTATWLIGWAQAIVNRPLYPKDLPLLNIIRSRLAEFLPNAYSQTPEGHSIKRKPLRPVVDSPDTLGPLLTTLARLYQRSAELDTGLAMPVRLWMQDWAIYYYRLGLQAKADQPEARFYLALLYQSRRFATDAAREYCNTLLIAPDLAQARYNLGLSLVQNRQWVEGLAQMHNGIEQLAANGKQNEAAALLERWDRLQVLYKPAIAWSNQHPNGEPRREINPSCLQWVLPAQ